MYAIDQRITEYNPRPDQTDPTGAEIKEWLENISDHICIVLYGKDNKYLPDRGRRTNGLKD
jgi:fatty acid-binding protein DegV